MYWKLHICNPKDLKNNLNKRDLFLYLEDVFLFLDVFVNFCRFSIKYICLDNFILAKHRVWKNVVEVIVWKLFWQAVRDLYQVLENVHELEPQDLTSSKY